MRVSRNEKLFLESMLPILRALARLKPQERECILGIFDRECPVIGLKLRDGYLAMIAGRCMVLTELLEVAMGFSGGKATGVKFYTNPRDMLNDWNKQQ